MENKKTLREIILESTVILSSLLIFFGFLKQYWFYSNFGINIQNYISIEETIIMFLGELPFVIKLILIGLAYCLFIRIIAKFIPVNREKNETDNSPEELINNTIDELLNSTKKILFYFIISIGLGFIGVYLFHNYKQLDYIIIYSILMFAQSALILFELFPIDQQVKYLTIIMLSLSIMLYFKNIMDIENILTNEKTIIYKNQEKDENYIFIGKTKDYIFLYNKLNKSTRIIKAENFIELEIK